MSSKVNQSDLDARARYLRLRSRDGLIPAKRIDDELRATEANESFALVSVDSGRAYSVGQVLVELDRELRRAAALVQQSGKVESLPRPIPQREGGLEIIDAAPGSFDAIVQGVGVISVVLLSQPVQTLLTLSALIGKIRSIQVWLKQRNDPLARISARDALHVLKEFDAYSIAGGELGPGRSLDAGGGSTVDKQFAARATAPGVRLDLPGGVRAQVTRIVYVRLNADGTRDFIVAE
jgi:hypothetical protein